MLELLHLILQVQILLQLMQFASQLERSEIAHRFGPTQQFLAFFAGFRGLIRIGRYRQEHLLNQKFEQQPEGLSAQKGTYVRFNAEEMFAILAIEMQEAHTVVVGEDLGTVPEEIRKNLARFDCLGMWVLPFEAGHHPSHSMSHTPRKKLSCLNTHDMVPFAGYCQGRDIQIFKDLHLITTEEAHRQTHERQQMIQEWQRQDHSVTLDLLAKHYLEKMARSSCELMLVNVEDLWLETEPINVPGTWQEYPNWTKKLRRTSEDFLNDPKVKETLQTISKLRNENSE